MWSYTGRLGTRAARTCRAAKPSQASVLYLEARRRSPCRHCSAWRTRRRLLTPASEHAWGRHGGGVQAGPACAPVQVRQRRPPARHCACTCCMRSARTTPPPLRHAHMYAERNTWRTAMAREAAAAGACREQYAEALMALAPRARTLHRRAVSVELRVEEPRPFVRQPEPGLYRDPHARRWPSRARAGSHPSSLSSPLPWP